MKLIFTKILFVAALLLSTSAVFAQAQSPLNIALAEVNENFAEWNLTKADVTDMFVSDLTIDKRTGISRVYFQQRYAGIKANAAILNVSIDANGNVFFVAKQFIPELGTKVNSVIPTLTAEQALTAALVHLEVTPNAPLKVKKQDGARKFLFESAEFANSDIKVELQFQSLKDGEEVRLAWDVIVNPTKNSDSWTMRVDAMNGAVIAQQNLTLYCAHQNDAYHNHDTHCREKPEGLGSVKEALTTQSAAMSMLAEDGSMYNVFALPIESPAHGDRVLVENPAWLTASPYGWHDTNGVDGAEYTITRGNNVWAFQDRNGDGGSEGDEPDGGAELIFDFPYDGEDEPENYIDAATANLFYMVNKMHDFSYANGMDETGGAFQDNNYGNGGQGNDAVIARAQQGVETGEINNANFSTPTDGESGVMNMFVWDQSGGSRFLRVDAPANIATTYETGLAVDWSTEITSTNGVTGSVVEVNDGNFNPYATDACEDLLNGADIAGKIALIDRGGCDFSLKVFNAQEEGAIAVIICNFEDATINMAAGSNANDVEIPVVFIKSNDCATIRQFAGDGLEVTLIAPEENGPNQLDGDFDNGIIAHEFGHGISNRLTCGPNNFGLGGGEQMGEGWSDFMGLVLTTEEGDTGEMRRGVGTFVQRQPNNGLGIRRYPYSTDMNVQPLTYGDVAGNTGVHAIGEVWCSAIWDLYWAFVAQDGWDADVLEGTGGNNMAVRLVFEGMKNQACSPGFVDGRDAILAADMALNGGANQCMIWEVFARRGVGFYAEQGTAASGSDQVEDFEPRPTCIEELKMTKEVSPLVNAGEDIDVIVRVINHKPEAVTDVVVTDELPMGTSYVAGSGSIEGVVSGNMVSFSLGTMQFEDEINLTYKLATDPDVSSTRKYYEDVEEPQNWLFDTFNEDDETNSWTITDFNSNSGEQSFFVENITEESQEGLFLAAPILIDGDNPVIRFYHNYDTEGGADAGLFEATTGDPTDIATVWTNAGENLFRGVYPGLVQYSTFVVPNLDAFSGDSNGWIASYVDMSDYAGQEIYIRYKFGTNAGNLDANVLGWFVDDIEFMDMVNYNADACISSAEGDNVCFTPKGRGTVIESDVVSSTFEAVGENLTVAVYPNPANDFVHIRMNTTELTDVEITLYSVDGRLLQSQDVKAIGEMDVPMNVSALSQGFYFLHVNADGNVYTEKLVIN